MKNRKLKTFLIYTICIVTTAFIMFSLNYILRLPAFIKIIGDENTWLPIIADAIVAAMIFIAGNWFSNEDRLRNEVRAKKEDYNVVSESVCRVLSALNIKRKQLYIIYSLDPNMNSRTLLSEIMQVQQEIENAINSFEQTKYIITSESELKDFEETYKTLEHSFQIVLDGLMKTINQWCDEQSKSVQTGTVVNLIGQHSDKIDYAILYAKSCEFLEQSKKKFLNTYYSQGKRLDSLLGKLNKSADELLKAESAIIKQLESKI